jgi:hypothetical protein
MEQLVCLIKMSIVFGARVRLEYMLSDLVANLTKLHKKVWWNEVKEAVIAKINLCNLERLQVGFEGLLNFCEFFLQVVGARSLKVLASTI